VALLVLEHNHGCALAACLRHRRQRMQLWQQQAGCAHGPPPLLLVGCRGSTPGTTHGCLTPHPAQCAFDGQQQWRKGALAVQAGVQATGVPLLQSSTIAAGRLAA